MAWVAAGTAVAQEDVCAEPFDHDLWQEELAGAERALTNFRAARAAELLTRTRARVPCLEELADPAVLARFAQLMALTAFFEQDEINALRWARLAYYAQPDRAWPAGIEADHPLRQLLDRSDTPHVAGPPQTGLAHPRRGGIFMNGHFLATPLARSEVPNLIQIADHTGQVVSGSWQDGAAFRAEILGPVGPPPTPPRWFVTASDPGSDEGDRAGAGRAPVGRLVLSAALGVAAVSLYGAGAVFRSGLDDASNGDELVAARSRTNLLVIGAGVAGVGAVGVGVTALVGDASGVRLSLFREF